MFDSLPNLTGFYTALSNVPWWQIALEWLVIGTVCYWTIRFLQGTRGARVFKGVAVVLITLGLTVRLLGGVLDLDRLQVLFQQFLFYATFAILLVFQPELRRALMRLGETRLFRGKAELTDDIDQLVESCATLSRRRVGALVAIERDVGLGGYTEEATPVDAQVTSALLTTIFHPNTALHDLGVVLRNGRLAFAGVQFPLAESGDLPKELGSRHRAAVGLSQETDAIVVIVSEETGDISIAERGELHRKLGVDRLRELLYDLIGQSVPLTVKAEAKERREKREAGDAAPGRAGKATPAKADGVKPRPPTKPKRNAAPDADDAPAPIRESKPIGGTRVSAPPDSNGSISTRQGTHPEGTHGS